MLEIGSIYSYIHNIFTLKKVEPVARLPVGQYKSKKKYDSFQNERASKSIDAKKENDMENWIPFAEGEYIVDQALIIAPDERAVAIENAVIEIFETGGGQRHLKGSGRIQNILLVELLEESDDLDLILDLGDAYQYRLKKPELQSGKFFAPDAKSSIQFRPSEPWEQIPSADFEKLMSRINRID